MPVRVDSSVVALLQLDPEGVLLRIVTSGAASLLDEPGARARLLAALPPGSGVERGELAWDHHPSRLHWGFRVAGERWCVAGDAAWRAGDDEADDVTRGGGSG